MKRATLGILGIDRESDLAINNQLLRIDLSRNFSLSSGGRVHSPSHLCPLKEKILPDVASRRTSSSILLYSPDSISISTR